MTVQEFRPEGTTGEDESGLFYRSWCSGPDGAHYELLKEEHHTTEDVQRARGYLRANFDVVSAHIIRETK